MSPRPGLMPGIEPRSLGAERGQLADELAEGVGLDHEALDAEVELPPSIALGGGGQVAHRAAHPDQPVARPLPASRASQRLGT